MAGDIADRVRSAAERVLAKQSFVTLIDVLLGVRFLEPVHLEDWRCGRVGFLSDQICVGANKLENTIREFIAWAAMRNLTAVEAHYTRQSREGAVPLHLARDPQLESVLKLRYVSPAFSDQERKRLTKADEPADRVVLINPRDSACDDCGSEIPKDDLLTMGGKQALCLACGGLDELEFLAAGDVALTRRSKKYSSKFAVVLKWNRSRKRYERQGLLIEESALARAEQECVEDAGQRAAQRVRSAKDREKQDVKLVAAMMDRIRELYPHCPEQEAGEISAHAAKRGSGRVGRSAAGRALDSKAVELAVRAAVRHRFTDYDELLNAGVDREEARSRVRERIDGVIASWAPNRGRQ